MSLTHSNMVNGLTMEENKLNLQVLLVMYDESQKQRRNYESMRANVTIWLTTIYVALVGLIIKDDLAPEEGFSILVVLSLFGIFISLAYTERYVFYWRRGQKLREYLDGQFAGNTIRDILKEAKLYRAEELDERKWPNSLPCVMKHHNFWMLWHGVVCVLALLCLIGYLWCRAGECGGFCCGVS